jgi:2-oxo-4-hydroxy-4-carboxy-5-ureidoimidazoline decarboxylase
MSETLNHALDRLNHLPAANAIDDLLRCCGSRYWANAMAAQRPFASVTAVLNASDAIAEEMDREDWLEAFSHHPKIGDISALRAKFAGTAAWAQNEQSGTSSASEEVLQGLADGNRAYEEKFGYIFIICATGKSAAEMLAALEQRLHNTPDQELLIAAEQQQQITRLRLCKLLGEGGTTA